jgi:hypothetical protein
MAMAGEWSQPPPQGLPQTDASQSQSQSHVALAIAVIYDEDGCACSNWETKLSRQLTASSSSSSSVAWEQPLRGQTAMAMAGEWSQPPPQGLPQTDASQSQSQSQSQHSQSQLFTTKTDPLAVTGKPKLSRQLTASSSSSSSSVAWEQPLRGQTAMAMAGEWSQPPPQGLPQTDASQSQSQSHAHSQSQLFTTKTDPLAVTGKPKLSRQLTASSSSSSSSVAWEQPLRGQTAMAMAGEWSQPPPQGLPQTDASQSQSQCACALAIAVIYDEDGSACSNWETETEQAAYCQFQFFFFFGCMGTTIAWADSNGHGRGMEPASAAGSAAD